MAGKLKKLYKTAQSGNAKYERAKSLNEVYHRIKSVVDKETRAGSLMTEGVGATLKLASRWFGRNLASHPYFKYYTKHLEMLASALNAAAGSRRAVAAWKNAAAAAGAAGLRAELVKEYAARRNDLTLNYVSLLRPALDAVAAEQEDPLEILESLDGWQDAAVRLADDALQLLVMVQTHKNRFEQALKVFERETKRMSTGNWFDRFAAASAKRVRDFDKAHGTFEIAMGDSREALLGAGFAVPLNAVRDALQAVSAEARACARLATIAMRVSVDSRPRSLAAAR